MKTVVVHPDHVLALCVVVAGVGGALATTNGVVFIASS